jgi:tetratricopeptide (TPR) repeat protein
VDRRSRDRPWAIRCAALALVLVGSWAYSTSFKGVFVGDDIDAIADNPHLKSLWPLTAAMSAPPDTTLAGRPVASLTFALNYALAPPDVRDVLAPGVQAPLGSPTDPFFRSVWGYHAVNLAVHIGAALLLFGVVRRTLLSAPLRARFGSGSTALAFAVSLLWLLHPLQTESVTYVVQRVESLMGLFYLSTLYGAIRALEAGPGTSRRLWTAASIAACVLGMGSKEAMVGAPIMVAVWIWVCRPEDRLFGPATRSLLVGLAAAWIPLAILVMGHARTRSVGFGLQGWTAWSYLVAQAGVIVHYLRLSVLPSPLVFWYAWRSPASWMSVVPQAVFLLALAATTVFALVRRHPLGLVGAWFFLVLAPSSSILPVATEIAAEHRMYLPVASVVALVVIGGYALGQRTLAARGTGDRRVSRTVQFGAWLAVGIAAAAFATMTRERNRDYWSNETLLADSVRKSPENADARIFYGVELLEQGRSGEAESQLRVALSLPPRQGADVGPTAAAHMYLGSALCAQNKLEEGISQLEQALALNPRLSEAHGFLAEAYVSQGRYAKAAASFEQALAGLPDLPPLLHRAAWFYATTPDALVRNGTKAVELAERAVRLTSGRNWMMLDVLGVAYAEQGNFAEAASAVRRALDIAQSGPGAGAVPELQRHLALFEAGHPLRSS